MAHARLTPLLYAMALAATLTGILAGTALATSQTAPATAANPSLLELPGGRPAPAAPANMNAPSTPPSPSVPLAGANSPSPAVSTAAPSIPTATTNPSAAIPGGMNAPSAPAPVPSGPLVPTNPSAVAPTGAAASQATPDASHPSAMPSSRQVLEEIAKNPDIIFEPVYLADKSMMFSKSDMDIIVEALRTYDSIHNQKAETTTSSKDSLSSLLDSIKAQSPGTQAQQDAPPPLPNLYLGSIVYYSPANWSVWINGKKLINKYNRSTSEFYVTRISRTQVELIWKPVNLGDVSLLWKERIASKEAVDPHILVDLAKGTITLQLKTNQSFLPKSLAIREGLFKSVMSTPVAALPTGALPFPSRDTAPKAATNP